MYFRKDLMMCSLMSKILKYPISHITIAKLQMLNFSNFPAPVQSRLPPPRDNLCGQIPAP